MSSLQLRPPENFDFKCPDNWPKWRRRFQQFREASGLSGEDDVRQVSTLLYCLGEEANDVLASTHISEEDKKVFSKVVEKLDDYFKVRHNVIFERARFNQRNQLPGESAEKYIAEIYRLAENCKFGELKDELIRDRLVVGILDKKTSQQLQMDSELTVEKAKKTIRQKEAVQEQGKELESEKRKTESSLEELERTISELQAAMDELRRDKGKGHRGGSWQQGGASGKLITSKSATCSRCGYGQHSGGERCPAGDARCHKCNRKGHFSSKCFSKTVARTPISEVDCPDTEIFLDAVSDHTSNTWRTTVSMLDKLVEFKIDTGAGVTAITETTYLELNQPKLHQAQKKLCGPAKQRLQVLGFFQADLQHQQRIARVNVYVIRGLTNNLLGLPGIKSLHLLEKLCEVNDESIMD